MQITESIVAQISRKTFNQMFDPALRRSKVLMSGNGSSVNWAENAGHANSADSLTDLSQIESMLADYVSDTELETTLADYATKSYVDQNYLSLSFFNALFQARTSQGAAVAPNSGDTTTIDNIKAMFGFWTDQYISALGQGADGGAITSLAALTDVSLSLPLADGEVLTYNSTLGKWTNGAGFSTAWANITGKPTTIAGYGITDAHITNGVITLGANSITPITSLSGYATESWVNTLLADYVTTSVLATTLADYVTTTALGTTLADYATKTYVDQNYLSLAFFNALFQARTSAGVAVAPNSGDTTTIDNIKAMFGFWTDQYISALGQGADGGTVTSLAQLTDVELSTPINDGEVLTYSTTLGKWTNGTGSVDMTTVWNALAGSTSEQINASHLSTALSGYATTSQLANYLPLSGGTLTGDLEIYKAGGGTPTLYFQRGTIADEYTDWKICNYNGYMYFDSRDSGQDYTTRMYFSSDGYIYASGYNKINSSNSYVLLGGGGHAAISGLSVSYASTSGDADTLDGQHGSYFAAASSLNNYLPLTGGTLTESLYIGTDSILLSPSSGNPYLRFHVVDYYWHIQIANNLLYLGTTSDKSVSIDTTGNVEAAGYRIKNYDNTYVITAGGGKAAISGLSVSYATSAGSATDSTKLPLAGGTMTGALRVNQYIFGYNYGHGGNAPAFVFDKPGSNYTGIGANGEADTIYFSAATISNGEASWVTSYKQKWKFNGTIYQEGNAVIHAGNIGSQSVNYATSAGDADTLDGQHSSYYAAASSLNNYLPLTGGTLTGSLKVGSNNGNYVEIGAIRLVYDSTNNALKVVKNDGTTAANFYATGGVSALGMSGDISIGYLPLTGGTLTGALTVNADITAYDSIVHGRGCEFGYIEVPRGQNIINSKSGYVLYLNYTRNDKVVMCMGGGNVGIGTTTTSYKLHVNGQVGATAYNNTSDERIKLKLYDKELSVESIANAPSFAFKWNDTEIDTNLHVGSTAQYWRDILPECVTEADDSMRTLSMQYGVAALIASISIARKVVNHEERISALERECKEWKDAYHSLKMDYEQLMLKIA